MKKYFTTPIYYVNDIPHIGHAYCTLATDTLARYWRKKIGRENVYFLTGTDENSQKTLDAARSAGQSIEEYLDGMAAQWKEAWDKIGINYDDFIRTTEGRHKEQVHTLLKEIHGKGDIYKGTYKGLYCTGCEAFLKDSELDENKHCPHHKKAPKTIEEENYFFRLSKYEDALLKMYEDTPSRLQPEKRRNEVVNFIKSGLEDISISRETAEFGIPLPWDENHVIYVWFDALINYYTGVNTDKLRDFWPTACHVVGKDITKFHCVIWPAMLLSAGIEMYSEVFAHGFFTIDGHKMSKSFGNVVDPVELAEKFGNDALRVGTLSSFEFGNDGDFSLENFENFYNKKLAGGVGNLFNRVTVLIHKFLDGAYPGVRTLDQDALDQFELLFEQKKIKAAIDHFFHTVDSANELLNETEVWKMAKVDLEGAKKVFAQLLQKLGSLAEMAEVLLPESAPKMKKMLGDDEKVGEAEILFERR